MLDKTQSFLVQEMRVLLPPVLVVASQTIGVTADKYKANGKFVLFVFQNDHCYYYYSNPIQENVIIKSNKLPAA